MLNRVRIIFCMVPPPLLVQFAFCVASSSRFALILCSFWGFVCARFFTCIFL